MVPNFARDASAAWLNGWEAHVNAPFARFKQKTAGVALSGLPGLPRGLLLPPGSAPIRFKPRLRTPSAAPGLAPSLGRIGSLEVRLATSVAEIRRAQRLRYRVFYEEMSAVPSGLAMLSRRDIDDYDVVCDHLLVIDHAAMDAKSFPGQSFRRARPKVVGTYRLLRQETADRHFGFYTAGEYDIAPVMAANPGARVLELGRSCVLKPYRTKRTVELLWAGIWAYVRHHRIDAMLGCASLEGTDPDRLALPLSFLHHHARAAEGWCARAVPERYVAMDRLAREAVDPKAALQALPPLVKGYLRVGATFGDGAVVDRQFGTTDVFVVLPVSAIAARYRDHFGPSANRQAA
ncbi:GNAT family N-acyltransferase [Methylobacterium sp.]|jgi:putative hemolysin|uniref:GNAT family N-acetyltransferase n=1 Tax=Methylobacterium sp. TaxID=409 RepID=UPI00262E2D7A|nr:GNAT family N-acyltransferase [Methylobacterium sp.]MDB5646414.1 ornithine--acyl-ACP N-acyltransferase OlsB [Methylobacterium sp.]